MRPSCSASRLPEPAQTDNLAHHARPPSRATLTPIEGSGYFAPATEAKRQAVNAWIRGSGAYDAVIDFDLVTRDPGQPTRFLPAYDSGDHLHPGDAGYQAMADAIDLRLFQPADPTTAPTENLKRRK